MRNLSLLFLLTLILLSCSKNDTPEPYIPRIAGKDLQKNEIQIVFDATPEHSSISFDLKLDNKNQNFTINWGNYHDTKPINYKGDGIITYDFPKEIKTYVITLNVPDISEIKFLDIEENTGIKSLYFGTCNSLKYVLFNSKYNKLEKVDATQCSLINEIGLTINNKDFDFNGLKKVKKLNIEINIPNMNFSLKGSEAERVDIRTFLDNIGEINISSCANLLIFNIGGNFNTLTEIASIKIEFSPIKEFYLSNLLIESLDLSKVSDYLTICNLSSFYCKNLIIKNKTITNFKIFNSKTNIDKIKNHHIKTLDFTDCKNIEELYLRGLSNLENININNADNIKVLSLNNNPSLKSIDIKDKDLLKEISITDVPKMESFILNNLKSLERVDVTIASLKKLLITNVPKLAYLILTSCNITEDLFFNFFNKLPNTLLDNGDPRAIDLFNNPCNTNEIMKIIDNSGIWWSL